MLLRRRIPRVAAAALVFGGGCTDESNVSADERAALASYAASFCDFRATCFPVEFADAYAGPAACEDTRYDAAIARVEDVTSGYGEACGDAFLAYYDCKAAAYAADCYADVATACMDEIAMGYAYCGSSGA